MLDGFVSIRFLHWLKLTNHVNLVCMLGYIEGITFFSLPIYHWNQSIPSIFLQMNCFSNLKNLFSFDRRQLANYWVGAFIRALGNVCQKASGFWRANNACLQQTHRFETFEQRMRRLNNANVRNACAKVKQNEIGCILSAKLNSKSSKWQENSERESVSMFQIYMQNSNLNESRMLQ